MNQYVKDLPYVSKLNANELPKKKNQKKLILPNNIFSPFVHEGHRKRQWL